MLESKQEQFSKEQLDALKAWKRRAQENIKIKNIKSEQNDEIENIKKEVQKTKANVEQVLDKHMQDKTFQPLKKFTKNAKKETGVTEGYHAEYQYDDQTAATFMVKSFLIKLWIMQKKDPA